MNVVDCERLLRVAGYVLMPKRDLWFSLDHRRAFSHQVLRDHDPKWLEIALLENVPEGEFRFYRMKSDYATCVEVLDELAVTGILVAVESIS